MKILISGTFPFPSGSALSSRARNLALALKRQGCQVDVFPVDHKQYFRRALSGFNVCEWSGIRILRAPVRLPSALENEHWLSSKLRQLYITYLPGVAFGRGFERFLRACKYDCVLLHHDSYTILSFFLRSVLSHGVFTIIDVVEDPSCFFGIGGRLNPNYWNVAAGFRWAVPRADLILLITSDLYDLFSESCPGRVLLLPSVETYSVPSTPLINPGEEKVWNVVYVGALLNRDCPAELVGIMGGLAEMDTRYTFHLVGPYERNRQGRHNIRRFTRHPVLKGRMVTHGYVSERELHGVLLDANAYILLREDTTESKRCFPTRLVELLKYQTPVIISDVGDIRKYLSDGRDAILLPPGEPTESIKKIHSLFCSKERRRSIGQSGYARAAQVFSSDWHAQKLLREIEKLRQAKREPA